MKSKNSIDQYILDFPKETQNLLEQMRATIKKTAPNAEEVISYGMPSFKLNGMLVWFAAYKKHIGFYPRPSGIDAFKKELSVYKGAKGSVQFPIDKPLPVALITKIVKFRVKENLEKAEAKKSLTRSKPADDFLTLLAAPARRALENKGIKTLRQLSKFSETEILELHGMGKSSIPKLRSALEKTGLTFNR